MLETNFRGVNHKTLCVNKPTGCSFRCFSWVGLL